MLPMHIALTTLSNRIERNDLARVAAALQKQVTRDFAPIWGVSATVDAFDFDDLPSGYAPIIVQDAIDDPGAAGFHRTQDDGSPYALVLFGPSWSLAASHECLEMLADPSASLKRPAQSLIPGQGRVDYLVEVCDPCEAPRFAYTVNGVTVSDFYTPAYFDPVTTERRAYSFTGAIRRPLEVLAGGYLSWFHGGSVFQARADANGRIGFIEAPAEGLNGRPLREFVDALTPNHQAALSRAAPLADHQQAAAEAARAGAAHALRIGADIERRFGARNRLL